MNYTSGHTPLYEDYVSFEISKLLKEKGFDEKCHSAWLYNPRKDNSEYFVEYLAKGTENNTELEYFNEKDTNWAYSAPTLQMAMKWLREVHKYFIGIGFKKGDYLFIIKDIKNELEIGISSEKFVTFEEAVEAALKYCLTNLI